MIVAIVVMYGKVYHSSFVNEDGVSRACGCPLLPLKSHIKGPAPVSDQGFSIVFCSILLVVVSECEICFDCDVWYRYN